MIRVWKIALLSLLSLIAISTGFLMPCICGGKEELIVVLDKTEVYPSQDFTIYISYKSTIPEGENYTFHKDPINMVVTTSGLVEDKKTTDYLLTPLVGSEIESDVEYPAAEVKITVPAEAGEYGSKEETYQVYIKNLEEYSPKASIKILAVTEKLTLQLEKRDLVPGDEIKFTVKYTLLTPGVVLERPLSEVNIDTNLPHALEEQPTINFPRTVESGKEITIATGTIRVKEGSEAKSYTVKVIGSPPAIESNIVELTVQDTSSSTEPSPTPSPSEGGLSPTSSSELSNNLIKGALSGIVGFGLVEVLNRLLGGKSKVEKTPEIEPVQGSSEGEDMVLLRSRDETRHARLQRYLESQERSTSPLSSYHRYDSGWIEYKRLTQDEAKVIDDKFEAERLKKGQGLGDEYDELMKNKPKWLEQYRKERWKKTRWRTEPDVVWESQFQETFKKNLSQKDIEDYSKWYEHYKSFQRRNFHERTKGFGKRFAAICGSLG